MRLLHLRSRPSATSALIALTLTAAGLAAPAAAGAADPAADQGAAVAPVAAASTPKTADDCSDASLKQKAATAEPATKEAPAELQGKIVYTCVAVNRPASGAAATARSAALAEARATSATATAGKRAAALTRARAGDVETQAYLELPEFCTEHAFDGLWWGTRTENCRIDTVTVLIFVETNGVRRHIGTAEALESAFAYTSADIDTFAFQLGVRKYWSEGYGNFDLFAQIYGISWCDGACKPNEDTGLQPGWFRNRTDNRAEAFWDSTATEPGDIGYGSPHWQYRVQYPGTRPSDPRDVSPPQVRCDNAYTDDGNNWNDPEPAILATPGAGCVFSGYAPVMSYSKSGEFGNLATHVEAAQQSGLPGAYPDGTPLRRLVDSGKKRANGEAACPREWERPEGTSCDEYPPRSTKQGAAQPPLGTARTFAPPNTSWCQMDPDWNVPTGVTGPTGWSSCMLPARENSVGGSLLGGFYRSNRVLDDDPFFIEIKP